MYKTCQLKEREDRLYMLWVAYYTNPLAGGKRKSWDEFLSASTTKSTPPDKDKIGNISGVDLAQVGRR